jgi:hypothetical protein
MYCDGLEQKTGISQSGIEQRAGIKVREQITGQECECERREHAEKSQDRNVHVKGLSRGRNFSERYKEENRNQIEGQDRNENVKGESRGRNFSVRGGKAEDNESK